MGHAHVVPEEGRCAAAAGDQAGGLTRTGEPQKQNGHPANAKCPPVHRAALRKLSPPEETDGPLRLDAGLKFALLAKEGDAHARAEQPGGVEHVQQFQQHVDGDVAITALPPGRGLRREMASGPNT
jgi:hypothetical protein